MNNIIVAYSKKNRVIGLNGKMPWGVIKDDMKSFIEKTKGNIVVMGRLTWDSLFKKPLPNRINIVVTKDIEGLSNKYKSIFTVGYGPYFVSSLEEAIKFANNFNKSMQSLYETSATKNLWIIGGASIYKEALEKDLVDGIWATEIDKEYDGDTFFPSIEDKWEPGIIGSLEECNIIFYHKKRNNTKIQ